MVQTQLSSSGMQSAPAADAEAVALMRAEAEAVVPSRTHHPSLLMSSGGHELDAGGIPITEEHSPVLAALRDTVPRLEPGRHWVATSPTGPCFHNRLDAALAKGPQGQHDMHGPWGQKGLADHHTLYNAGSALAHTEFGVEGMTNLRTLHAVVPEPERWPVDRSNAVYRHLGKWWDDADPVQQCVGASCPLVITGPGSADHGGTGAPHQPAAPNHRSRLRRGGRPSPPTAVQHGAALAAERVLSERLVHERGRPPQ